MTGPDPMTVAILAHLLNIEVDCRCRPAWAGRGLPDPDCVRHTVVEPAGPGSHLAVDLAAALEAYAHDGTLPVTMPDPAADPCHCGEQIRIEADGYTRGLCADCSDARCDAYPGACLP